ncbi:MAG TPA: hypothetical protein VFT82_01065, partial [Candidatus Paceibacterota bacterium]|nr:hypothetical protein [Candidatus Paceibacterota bacterium]
TQAGGATVYEPDGQTYQASYECLYQKTQKYNEQGERYFPYSFDVFETRHPIFFYVDAHGAIVPFVSREIVPPAEKAKPVIYLYPTKTTEVHVALNPDGGFTKTVPLYGSGWDVIAKPSGALTNVARGAAYPYLFWEGGGAGVTPTPEKGFVVSKSDVPSFLVKTLAEFGLNQKEIGDFTDFWVPKLSTAPYYFITFVDRADIDRTAPLSVTPAPDTVIRVLMDYRPLDKKISVEPLPISKTERQGFTVVEWGGVLRK